MLGQLWTLNGTTLTNKLEIWKSYEGWSFTNNNTFIENIFKNKTLGTKDFNIVGIQSTFDKSESSWRFGETRTDGYFTITHLTSQKLLVGTNIVERYKFWNSFDFEPQSLGLIYKGK